jgi:hypothetical protein
MRSRKFSSLKKPPPLYESLEFACVAARHGSEWILISGKAVLSTGACPPEAQIVPVVKLQDIIALQGRIPAEGVDDLIANLRDFWVVRDLKGINVRLTAKGAGDYSWRPPGVIRRSSNDWTIVQSSAWKRAFTLCGNGPDRSSLPSYSTLQEIDSQLRSSTPAFNGFDGLCGKLGLPVRRSNLTSSFQVSAELPAWILGVNFEPSERALQIGILCDGSPDLMVEWLPQHEFQRVPSGRIRDSTHDTPLISFAVPGDSTAAELILAFGELQADVAKVDLRPWKLRRIIHTTQLWVMRAMDTPVPDLATRKAPNQKLPNLTYHSEIKRAIQALLIRNVDASDLQICRGLDARDLLNLA